MVLCLLLQMLLTKPATMITIMINERMMIRIRIMIMVMQTGVFCTSERTAKPCSSRDGPAHVWSTESLCLYVSVILHGTVREFGDIWGRLSRPLQGAQIWSAPLKSGPLRARGLRDLLQAGV